MSRPQAIIPVILFCDHELLFKSYPPKMAERVWCPRCTDMQTVKVAPPEFRVKCRNCRLSRPFGQSREDAERLAAKHHNVKNHTVELRDGYAVLYTWHGPRARDETVIESILETLDLNL
jgi:hypothetical protein